MSDQVKSARKTVCSDDGCLWIIMLFAVLSTCSSTSSTESNTSKMLDEIRALRDEMKAK